MTATKDIEARSPCIRNCCLDQHDVCLGCKRTLDEILRWSNADNKERLDILRACEHRRALSNADTTGIGRSI